VHVNGIFGPSGSAASSFPGPPSNPPFGGAGIGFALGSPFFQLGGATSPVALAVRGGAEVMILVGSVYAQSGDGNVGLKATPLELSVAIAMTHTVSLEVRGAFGFVVMQVWTTNPLLVAPATETTLGLRF